MSTGTADSTELRRDVRRGLQGPARDVAQVLYNLAKTARSFGFYSRDNQAVGQFLEELLRGFQELLDSTGALRLVVGADRFVWRGDVVYLDADRERGLPFRLFRDGVRGVVFKPGLTLEELLALMEVLGRRQSTGRSAEEEDVVTLLWKLSFNYISYEAVEGFTHELHSAQGGDEGDDGETRRKDSGEALPRMMERISGKRETLLTRGRAARSFRDEAAEALLAAEWGADDPGDSDPLDGSDLLDSGSREAGADPGPRRGRRKTPVRDTGATAAMPSVQSFAGADLKPGLYPGSPHYPLVLRGGLVEIRHDPLGWEEVAALRKELEEEEQLGIIHLLDYCFELSMQEAGFFGPEDFLPMVAAIRRYLLRSRDLLTYERMVRYLRRIALGGIYPAYLTRRAADVVASCAAPEAIAALIAAASGDPLGEERAGEVLTALLPDLDPAALLTLLGHGMSEQLARVLSATTIKRTGNDLTLFEAALRIGDAPEAPRAMAALRCLTALRTPDAVLLIESAARWPDPAVRRATMRILGRVPMTPSTPGALGRGLRDPDADVREEALLAMRRQGAPELCAQLTRWLDEEGFKRLDDAGRVRAAALAAELDAEHATRYFKGRLNMNVLARVGGIIGTPEVVAWNQLCAVGLAAAATPEAIERLRAIRTQGDDAFRELVGRLLIRTRPRGTA